jgi:hypothetical protein
MDIDEARDAFSDLMTLPPRGASPVMGVYGDRETTLGAFAACYLLRPKDAEYKLDQAKRDAPSSVLVNGRRGIRLFWRRNPDTCKDEWAFG